MRHRAGALGAAVVCLLGIATSVQANIFVTDAGGSTVNTCTLAQAIALANFFASGIDPTAIGSQTTSAGTCTGAAAGGNVIGILVPKIVLTGIDNYWYGPNALPPIASAIVIVGSGTAGTGTTLVAQHVGDPMPTTANAFRFFYVSGGYDGELPNGSLFLQGITLQGGYAKGGNSDVGGGGAGMGGAIFNQGNLTLSDVSLIGNSARGGRIDEANALYSGGGMGADGGGFGGAIGSGWGGNGSSGSISGGGGGGGGFISGSSGGTASANGASGGGNGGLGGDGASFPLQPGGAAGDGGGGSGSGNAVYPGDAGGAFGFGGGGGISAGRGGGGGVGGGGSAVGASSGGGGGFGGGGGAGGGGGFGGGGGGYGYGGFGGGSGLIDLGRGAGGAGMGGAIFNHAGTVYLINVTATGNGAYGGAGYVPAGNGSGLGAVLFNLNGTVTIDFSTLAGNTLASNNALADSKGPEDGTVYSLAYGNKIQDGSASSATLTIHNRIVHGTQADGGLQNDVVANVVNGANTNASSVAYAGSNFVQRSSHLNGAIQSGSLPSTDDPLLGSLSVYSASTYLLPVLQIGSNSKAYNAAPSCVEADGSTTLPGDERGAARPYDAVCDVGAYEFDGDYIFADGADVKL